MTRCIDAEGLRPFSRRVGLPVGVVRSIRDGRDVAVSNLHTACESLGLELYVGPPRGIGDARTILGGGENDLGGADAVDQAISLTRDDGHDPSQPGPARPLTGRQRDMLNGMLDQVKGPRARDRLSRAVEAGTGADTLTFTADELGDGFVLVPQYDVQAAAGPGRIFEAERIVDYLAFKESWVRRTLRCSPANLALIHAVGESMEPVIRSGDLLLVDTSVTEVFDDTIYVIVRGDYIVVKRLQRFFSGAVAVRSANPAYTDETLSGDDLHALKIVGRVVWVARQV